MDKSTGHLKAVAAYAKSVGIAADQLINAVLGGRLKPCPSAPTASACWMAGQVGGASFGSSTNCFFGSATTAGARMRKRGCGGCSSGQGKRGGRQKGYK